MLFTSIGMSQNYTLVDSVFKEDQFLRTYDIKFDLARWQIQPQSLTFLNSYAQFLKSNPKLIIEVQMHSDGRGSKYRSSCLTCKRADAIVNYLVEKGVEEKRLIPRGYGGDMPIIYDEIDLNTKDTLRIVLNNTYINQFKISDKQKYESLHQKNRRVEFKILATDYISEEVIKDNNIQLYQQLLGEFTNFTVDNFGNIYTTNKDVIVKYNPNLDTLFSTSLKTMSVSTIEASKSFRVLLFDKNRGVISFLDNTLTDVNGSIDLAELDVLQAVQVCESFNGNAFWVLDQGGMQLLKVNQNFEVLSRVDNLNFLFENRDEPIQMFEKNDELIIHFKNQGVAIFDVFGTYLKFLPIKGKYVHKYNTYFNVLSSTDYTIYELPLLDKMFSLNLPNNKYNAFKLKGNKLYLLSDKGIDVYSFLNTTNNK